MITLDQFLDGIRSNAKRIKDYELGHDGRDGTCDCVGLIIGALRLASQPYSGTHGSNYFARYYSLDLHEITDGSLHIGDLVYKAFNPGDPKYKLPAKYKDSGDLRDYYHIGIVMNVSPLSIWHCSSGGMNYDTKLGKWHYSGWCKTVGRKDDMNTPYIAKVITEQTPLNIRSGPGTEFNSIAKAPKDSEVTVKIHRNDWDFIEFDGNQGYASTNYLMPIREIHDDEPEDDEEYEDYTELRRTDGVTIRLAGIWEVV